jgi:hypothetical protein
MPDGGRDYPFRGYKEAVVMGEVLPFGRPETDAPPAAVRRAASGFSRGITAAGAGICAVVLLTSAVTGLLS